MLKRTFFTLTVAIGMVASVSAQTIGVVAEDSELGSQDDEIVIPEHLKPCVFSIGPKLGANYSIAGDPEDMYLDMSGGIGYNAGVALNLRFGRPAGRPFGTERFGVQLEALYSMRSLKTKIDDITMNCFEIPLLFQWYFVPNFAVEVGPTFTGTISASPKGFNYNNAVYKMDKMKSYDVMLSVGVNCKLKKGFTANVRYNLGNSELAENFKTKVSTVSVGIGWLFTAIK